MLSMTIASWEAKVLSVHNPCDLAIWDGLVDQAPISDVYYRAGYARANEAVDHGKAIALLLTGRNTQVLVPLLLRPLSDLPFALGQPGLDAVTPYGYGGLLPLGGGGEPSESDVSSLPDALQHWCNECGVISCHIRLHPLLDQTRCLDATRFQDHTASLCFRGLTTGIDLSKWDSADQRIAGMSATRRSKLNRARQHLRVLWSGSEIPMAEALRMFRQVYEHRMAQLHVSPYYYFSEEYYAALGEHTNLAVALAWFGDELAGGHLFLAGRRFAHYHLGAANEKGLKFNSCTLLVNAGAQWARELGCKLLHLGGGANGVFGYKMSYGGPVYRYHSLDVIADEPRYRNMVQRRVDYEPLHQGREGFFPVYRA
jgi:hypothetical protein